MDWQQQQQQQLPKQMLQQQQASTWVTAAMHPQSTMAFD
jgi:hypothetical protein